MENDMKYDVVWNNADYEDSVRNELLLYLGQRPAFNNPNKKPVWMTGAWKPYHQVSCYCRPCMIVLMPFADELAGSGDRTG